MVPPGHSDLPLMGANRNRNGRILRSAKKTETGHGPCLFRRAFQPEKESALTGLQFHRCIERQVAR
jgi:hypothetical protein